MKKLMVVTFAVAMLMNAMAATSLEVQGAISPYSKDTSSGNNSNLYSCYVMTLSEARNFFEGKSGDELKKIFNNNFADASSTVKENGQKLSFSYYDGRKYNFYDSDGEKYEYCDFIYGFFFYENGTDIAFTITRDGLGGFAEGGYYTSGWQTVKKDNVPEPTTGILMILGFMGLALKRKRV